MAVKISFRCPKLSRWKNVTSHSRWLEHIKLHHPERRQVAHQKNLTIHSAPQCVEPAQRRELHANKDSVKDLHPFPYLEHVEHIADSESRPLPSTLPRMDTYASAGAVLRDYIQEPWRRDAQGCLQTNLQNNPYYAFATCEKYKYIQCGIKKDGLKMYYDNVQKAEHTALLFPSFKNGDGVQKLVATMPDDPPLGEWELHTLEDMTWNDNHQRPIKYWCRDIIKSTRWLVWQPANAEHLIYTPQRCINSDTSLKHLYTGMHTVEWLWETQVRRDFWGRWCAKQR